MPQRILSDKLIKSLMGDACKTFSLRRWYSPRFKDILNRVNIKQDDNISFIVDGKIKYTINNEYNRMTFAMKVIKNDSPRTTFYIQLDVTNVAVVSKEDRFNTYTMHDIDYNNFEDFIKFLEV